MNTDEALIAGLFLCSDHSNDILRFLKPEWDELVQFPVTDKLKNISTAYDITTIFPWKDQLSKGINYTEFCKSFLIQPDLFLRIRPGYFKIVKGKLARSSIYYSEISNTCISLSNTTRVDNVVGLDKEAVIQDLNSQRVGELMKITIENLAGSIHVWDCCAASGGKSMMCYDIDPGIWLTVSDIRESILINLKKRFAKAGIRNYKSFITDLSKANMNVPKQEYDFIIADVPCSGSGTWSRTPEQLYYFSEPEIERYSLLQQKIINNVIDYLRPGGFLLYITCSVFRRENEDAVEFITGQKKLELKSMKLFTGYDEKADSLFGALFYRPI